MFGESQVKPEKQAEFEKSCAANWGGYRSKICILKE
jgi:hypothetical protein